MTTAHRPTFDPARGKEAQRGVAYHQRLQPAHTKLKLRQNGQGSTAETERRDLRAQLLEAEAAHFAKSRGTSALEVAEPEGKGPKRMLEEETLNEGNGGEDEKFEAKRRRILAETRDVDADTSGSEESSEEESDDEDEEAELMRELEKIKKERAAQREKEEQERRKAEQENRERDIALGNPLLNPHKDFNVKRRWDDDVVFKNQARGTEVKKSKEFVNDLLRSDFHKRFMSRYVR